MIIITLSGTDGSGKSTQAHAVREWLTARGERVWMFHAVEFSIANRLLRQTAPNRSSRSVTRAGTLRIFLRIVALHIDYIRFAFLRRRLRRHGYTVILSDRFFFDTVVNIRYLQRTTRCGYLERWVPPVDCALYLEVDAETLRHRERVPEQGEEYARKKSALFAQRRDRWNMILIDGTQPIDTVRNTIIHTLTHRCSL